MNAPQGPPPTASPLDVLIPTNPLAAVACWVGILSPLTCYGGIVLGPIALVCGILSLKRGALIRESSYGRGTSLVRSYIGIVMGVIGTLVGIGTIIVVLTHKHF